MMRESGVPLRVLYFALAPYDTLPTPINVQDRIVFHHIVERS